MPIRTHRGRAAVYRKVWGWPVRSPTHLTVTVLAAVVIAVGIGVVTPGKHPDATARAGPATSPRASTSVPAPALAGGGLRATRAPAPTSPAPAAALTVARSWVQAFLTVGKGTTSAQWVEQLRPFTTDDLFPELRSIDPANVPAAQIIDAPRTVSVSAGAAEVDVPTTALIMRLLVVSTPAGWRVASYERAG
ncbi:MAG TPA: hypothetical protein VJ757_05865 [Pseudonocardiaceae bacterium]|nr:hypothetical protein [Pseudonocardiaceae bacterium]